jgi:hypothetical protein
MNEHRQGAQTTIRVDLGTRSCAAIRNVSARQTCHSEWPVRNETRAAGSGPAARRRAPCRSQTRESIICAWPFAQNAPELHVGQLARAHSPDSRVSERRSGADVSVSDTFSTNEHGSFADSTESVDSGCRSCTSVRKMVTTADVPVRDPQRTARTGLSPARRTPRSRNTCGDPVGPPSTRAGTAGEAGTPRPGWDHQPDERARSTPRS